MYSVKRLGEVRCINLKSRPDRKEKCKQLFKKLGIRVKFFEAIKSEDGHNGCFDSHIACYKEALQKGLDKLVVFEDDITETSDYSESAIQDVMDFIEDVKHEDWRIFFLGLQPFIDRGNGDADFACGRSIYKTTGGWGAHAYIISRSEMKKLVNVPYKIQIDMLLSRDKPSYVRLPVLFVQDDLSNSNTSVASSSLLKVKNLLYTGFEVHASIFPWSILMSLLIISICGIVAYILFRINLLYMIFFIIGVLLIISVLSRRHALNQTCILPIRTLKQ